MNPGQAAAESGVSILVHDISVLFKSRVVLLLLVAAASGAFLGAGGWPGPGPLALLLIGGASASSGSAALNEFIERKRDALMLRTAKRPFVRGAIRHPRWIAALAVAMIAVPAVALAPTNAALAAFLLLGAIIYLPVYTLWLKPRTSLNIVIGGAAGSCAVLSGGAAAHAWSAAGVLALAGLVFFWTPIHFWALAIVFREDYARAGVPMLPVSTSPRRAALWGLGHGAACGLTGLALGLLQPALGPVYALPVAGATLALLWQGVQLVRQTSVRRAWRLFHTSNLYLLVVLLSVCLSTLAMVSW